jgi:hypothetical protein
MTNALFSPDPDPNSPTTGIFALAHQIQRMGFSILITIYLVLTAFPGTLPTETDDVTHETIHLSVLQQRSLPASLHADLAEHPELVAPLLPLEEALRRHWPTLTPSVHDPTSPLNATVQLAMERDTGLTTEAGRRVREKNWLGKIVHDVKSTLQDALEG